MGDIPVLFSQAHVTDLEVRGLTRAVTLGWVAPLGSEIDRFDASVCAFTGADDALALFPGEELTRVAEVHGLVGDAFASTCIWMRVGSVPTLDRTEVR